MQADAIQFGLKTLELGENIVAEITDSRIYTIAQTRENAAAAKKQSILIITSRLRLF